MADQTKKVEKPGAGILKLGNALLWLNMIFTFLFLYLPIIVLIIYSFNDAKLGSTWEGFTLKWYRSMLQSESIMGAFRNSLLVATTSTVISTVLGTMTAMAMERFRFRFKRAYDGLLYLPVVIPDIVMGISLLAFFSIIITALNGLFGLKGEGAIQLGLPTVILAHVSFAMAFVTINVRTSLRQVDPAYEEAAMDLGADEWTTFRKVTFPLITPGILGGALLAFTLSLDDFVITFFTTGPGGTTLPIEVFGRIKRAISPEINAISTVMLLLSITLIILSQTLQNRTER